MAELLNGLGGEAGFGENSVGRNDDGSSGFIDLTSVFDDGLNFFGVVYTGFYINTNGSITFDGPLSAYTPTTISSGTSAGIFPFWSDIDTRGGEATASPGGTSQGTNLIYYDLNPEAGSVTVTWDDVGYYSANTDKTNAFQLILTDVSDVPGRSDGDFLISFLYESIDWTTGDASGGSGGLGGVVARAGYSAGDSEGTYLELPSSGDAGAMLALDERAPLEFLSTAGGVTSNFELDLPDTLAPGEEGSAEISGASDGVAPTLVTVSAERGLVSDPFSNVFSDAVFVLDRGPEGVVDVSIKGTAGPRSAVDVTAGIADGEAVTNIAARTIAFQPEFIQQATLDRIAANLEAQFGETIGSLTGSLAQYAVLFEGFGLNANSATAALAAGIEAAGDYGTLVERGQVGSLGQGWATVADLGLAIDGTSVQMQGLTELSALRALSIDASALYTVSKSADRSIALSGDALSFASQARPTFEQGRDGKFQTTSAFTGSLEKTHSGYIVWLVDGTALEFNANGTFERMLTADGRTTEATLDGDGQIVSLSGPNGRSLTFTRSADGTIEKVEDADGREATFGYDANGQLSGATRPEGTSSFGYAENGDLVSATAPGNITGTFNYDERGRLESASYGGGLQTESFTYSDAGGLTMTDGAGRMTEVDLLPGKVVGRVTDGAGEASEIIYDDTGAIAGVRTADGTETRFTFDEQNRLTQITDANGAVLSFSYGEAGGQPESFTDAGGNTRSFEYDNGGRIIEATWPDGTRLEFDYDDQGNLTGYTNRRGDDVTYTYDERGRLLSGSDSSAGPPTYTYDASGRLTSATNDQGTTSLAYDIANRVTQIDYPTGKSLSFTYNEAGLRASMSDGGDYNVFYDYDALGRLTGLRDEDSSIVTYRYDVAGNLMREENGNGTVTTYDYDAGGRLTAIENLAPDSSVNSRTAYTYDAAGQRVAMETLDGAWDYGYDAIGQLTSAEFTSTKTEITDKSITYEYDAAGNRTRVVEDGVETLYTSNALNQYTRVRDATFTYDDDGNMTSRMDESGTTTYAYDLDNRLVSVTEADGTVQEFRYDVFGNRVSKTVDGAEKEYLVDPFGLGDVVSEFSGGARTASFMHGLGLAAGEIGGTDAWYDADGVGSVTALTGADGGVLNAYAYTPFGTEIREIESIANSFEFNGALGVAEDSDELTFMRARSYSDELGRFLHEDPLWLGGDEANLYRASANDPIEFADPSGEVIVVPLAYVAYALAAGRIGLTVYNAVGNAQAIYETGNALSEGRYGDAAASAAEAGVGILAGKFAGKLAGKLLPDRAPPGNISPVEKPYHQSKFINDSADKWAREITETAADAAVISLLNEIVGDPRRPLGPDESINIDGGPSGASDGDPHIRTFDGSGYSFQAVGEFILFRPKSGDSEFQVRQEAFGSSTTVSVNTAVTALLGDANAGVYAARDTPLVIDGVEVSLSSGESIAVGSGSVYFDGSAYVITDALGNGVWAKPSSTSKFMNLRPFASEDLRGQLEGLLGDADGDRSNDFALRDGTVIAQPLPVAQLYGEFADAWRINQDRSLFVYEDGENSETFTDRDFPSTVIGLTDLDPSARAQAEAVVAAAGLTPGTFEFDTTVLDVALTGIEEFAEAVKDAPTFAEEGEETEVVPVEFNQAPTAGADEAVVDEDDSVDISVLGNDSDPEDDDLFLISAGDANGGTADIVGDLVRFAPAADFEGQTTVTYQLGDSAGNVVAGTITVDVTGINDPPEAILIDLEEVSEDDAPVTFDALAAIVDVDNDLPDLSVQDVEASWSGGDVEATLSDGVITFDPDQFGAALNDGETADVRITFNTSDGHETTSNAVTLTVLGADDGTNPVIVEGTGDTDRLNGTEADEYIYSFGGRADYVSGGGGADVFIFGEETENGVREVDTIYDFGADDMLDLGERWIDSEINSRGNTYLTLDGDGDRIVLLGVADYEDGLLTA